MQVARETDAGELPAFFRLKKIAIGRADVIARSGAGTAAQHHLVAHELAVVLAERAGHRRDSRDRGDRRCASIPRHRRTSAASVPSARGSRPVGAGAGWKRSCRRSFPRSAVRTQRVPIRIRSATARRPSSRRRRPQNSSRASPVRIHSTGRKPERVKFHHSPSRFTQ